LSFSAIERFTEREGRLIDVEDDAPSDMISVATSNDQHGIFFLAMGGVGYSDRYGLDVIGRRDSDTISKGNWSDALIRPQVRSLY
jgi:hypothetical protein